jgi:hypothetical protein
MTIMADDLQPFLDAIHKTIAKISLDQEIPARFMLSDQTEVKELENPEDEGDEK